jgi:hypothetical protein
MTLAVAANAYAEQNWRVFPLWPGQKVPLTTNGCHDASCDTERVRKWWERCPNANIGLATGEGGHIALDFDVKDGKPGLETLELLQRRFDMETLTASTPTNGFHKVFNYPGPMFCNSVELLPGMDVRATNGYIVVAPSVVDGKPYRWTNTLRPKDMSPELIAFLKRSRDTTTPIAPHRAFMPNRLQSIERAKRYVNSVPGAIQGRAGDVATFKLACTLIRGFMLTDYEAMILLLHWNRLCRPPWSESELMAKIRSAQRNGREALGGRLGVRS